MPEKETMLSVAEVFELQPGTEEDPTWVNPGMLATVAKIVNTKVKQGRMEGRTMNICTLRDTVGSAEISMTLFQAAKFKEGDVIELSGGGIRRTEYKGMAQVTMGKNSQVHLVGKGVHHEDQERRKENLEPAPNGTKQRVNGQTVGMAMKEALPLATAANPELSPDQPEFWGKVHQYASTIIRLSNALEHGNLTPAMTSRAVSKPAEAPEGSGGRADPPGGAKPQPGAEGSVKLDEHDEDVPF